MPAFDQVVSLGRGCQPAWQIRRYTGITSAHVFDWVVTPDPVLPQVIASGFSDFFLLDNLAWDDCFAAVGLVPQGQAGDGGVP